LQQRCLSKRDEIVFGCVGGMRKMKKEDEMRGPGKLADGEIGYLEQWNL
jgi:hypothetical protein